MIISWFLILRLFSVTDDVELSVSNGTTIESGDNFSRLTVQGAKGSHSGVYKVKATNSVGEDEKPFTVNIKGENNYFCLVD